MPALLPENIKELIHANSVEWECLEFKEGYNPEVILHSICALANDINNLGGGHIAIGFSEDSGKPIFPVKGLETDQLEPYQQKIKQLCYQIEPYYSPIVKPYDYDGKMILLIWVPVGELRPYKATEKLGIKGPKRSYIRQGPNTILARSSDEAKLVEMSAKIKFDSRLHYDAPLDSIELSLIHSYLQQTNSSLFDDVDKLSREELCSSLLIAKGPHGFLRPLNTALLFFSQEPEKYFPGAAIHVVIFSDVEGTEFMEKQFKGPLNKQITDSLDFLKINLIKEKTRKQIDRAESKKITNYPFLGIEEALVNAVYHKSYELDSAVEVRIFPHLIQIISFPGPIAPVNERTIQQDRIDVREYRNPRIGQFLKDFRLCEERGTGISTIRKEMKKNGSLPPDFDFGDDNTYFMIILKIHPDWDLEEALDKSEEKIRRPTLEELLSNQEQGVVERSQNGATFNELLKSFNGDLNSNELKTHINALLDKKYLGRKRVKKLFGLIIIDIYYTTDKGDAVLKSSF